MKATVIFLMLIVLGLGTLAVYQHQNLSRDRETAQTASERWSNLWQRSQETLSVSGQTAARHFNTLRLRETQLILTSNELVRTKGALAELKEVMMDLQSEFDSAAEELRYRDDMFYDMRDRKDQAETTLGEAQDAYAQATNQIAEAAVTRTRLERQIEGLRTQLSQSQTNLVQYSNSLVQARMEVEKLERILTTQPAPLTQPAIAPEDHVGLFALLHQELGTVRSQLTETRAALEESRSESAYCRQAYAELKSQFDSLLKQTND